MKSTLLYLFVLCTLVTYGQRVEYSKSELSETVGFTFDDIKLFGFKDRYHAEKVLNAISYKGSKKKVLDDSYKLANLGDFVLLVSNGAKLLKDTYILHYRPRYETAGVVLEFYKLDFFPTNPMPTSRPKQNLKQVQILADEVKQLSILYAGNDNELKSVLNEQEQTLASIKKAETARKESIAKKGMPSAGTANKNEKTPANSKAPPANGKSPADYFNIAMAASKNNDPNKALLELQQGIQTHPNEAKLHAALGLLYISMPNRQKAYDCFKKVEQLEPSLLRLMYKKPILLGPIFASSGEVFNNVCIISPTYGIIAGNGQIRITNCDFLCRTGVQFGGLGIRIEDSFFDTSELCVEYTQTDTQIGNIFIGNKFYGQWSNTE